MTETRIESDAEGGDDMDDALYLARIAELEEEVRNLRAELAKILALGIPGVRAGLLDRGTPAGLDAPSKAPKPPSLVTADGTQGMRRGVSDGRSRSSKEGDAKH